MKSGFTLSLDLDWFGLRSMQLLCLGLAVWFLFASADSPIGAQTTSNAFQRVHRYGEEFVKLNEQVLENRQVFKELREQFPELQQRLAAAENDFQGLKGMAVMRYFRQAELALTAQAADRELNAIINRSQEPKGTGIPNLRGLETQSSVARTAIANLEQEINQLNLAQRATLERGYKILLQFEKLQNQLAECNQRELQIINQYVEHSDLLGTRSQWEWKAAVRALQGTDQDNLGARLAAGITLARLGRTQESADMLSPLDQAPAPFSTLAKLLHAERAARSGDAKTARELLSQTSNFKSSSATLLRARTYCVLQNRKEALREWESLFKVDALQIPAYASASITRLSTSASQNSKALQEAQAADDLAAGQNWFSKIALAQALAVDNQTDQALAAAQQAADLALGDKRQLCLDIADQIKTGQIKAGTPVQWPW